MDKLYSTYFTYICKSNNTVAITVRDDIRVQISYVYIHPTDCMISCTLQELPIISVHLPFGNNFRVERESFPEELAFELHRLRPRPIIPCSDSNSKISPFDSSCQNISTLNFITLLLRFTYVTYTNFVTLLSKIEPTYIYLPQDSREYTI